MLYKNFDGKLIAAIKGNIRERVNVMTKNKTVVKEFKKNVAKVRKVQNLLTNEDILYITAADPNTSDVILDALGKNVDEDIRAAVANNCSASIEILEYLSTDTNSTIRCSVASNFNTSVKVLEKLSKDKEDVVKLGVVRNLNVSRNCLKILSRQKDIGILVAVVQNSECSLDILQTLFAKSFKNVHPNEAIRVKIAMASNPKISLGILRRLSESKNFVIRLNAINNIKCPVDILENLSKNDPILKVRLKAQHKLENQKEKVEVNERRKVT